MADYTDRNTLWTVAVHVMPSATPFPQPAVHNLLITAPDELAARQHALIAAAFVGKAVLVDPEYGSMVYAEPVPQTSG